MVVNCSFPWAISVSSFAFVAFFNIPLSPLRADIVIPAKINNRIIVMTSATNVTPLCLLFFIHFFIKIPPSPFC